MQRQPNLAISIPRKRGHTNHYDEARIILIINAILVTLTKQKYFAAFPLASK